MTTKALKGDRQKCLAAGMSDCSSKPISAMELELTLVRWLSEE